MAGVDAQLGVRSTLLRANVLSSHPNFDAATMVVEVEPLDAAGNDGFTWVPITEADVESINPVWVRDTISAWLVEQASGWNELRPQWSRPGWLVEVGCWMRDEMEQAGYREPQLPQIHHLWGVTAVVAADSRDGTAYLKCSGQRFRHEAVVTAALAERSPELLPSVIAVEPDRGWMLMRDFEGTELGDGDLASWGLGLDALARLQRIWLGRRDELLSLGAEDRSLADLASWVAATADDSALLDGLTAQQREQWLAALPELVASCSQLEEVGPGVSLVHGDFHPWNALSRRDGTGVLVFDWTDASASHPFLDAVTYVTRRSDIGHRREMLDGYLAHWADDVSVERRAEVGQLALVVGALYQAQTYARLIPTVMPEDLSQLRGGDVEWMQRTLRIVDHGIAATY